MSTTTTPDRNSTHGRGIPRWVLVLLGLLVWLVGMPLVHGVQPWVLSWLGPRYGWTAGYPGTWNWLGLIPVRPPGLPCSSRIFASGLARFRELPERMERLVPRFLMTTGPYACTRNPMYVAVLALLLGWAILFGSVVVLLGLVVLTVVIILVLPREDAAREAIRRDLSPLPGQGSPMAGRLGMILWESTRSLRCRDGAEPVRGHHRPVRAAPPRSSVDAPGASSGRSLRHAKDEPAPGRPAPRLDPSQSSNGSPRNRRGGPHWTEKVVPFLGSPALSMIQGRRPIQAARIPRDSRLFGNGDGPSSSRVRESPF